MRVLVNAGPFHEVRRQHDGYDLGFYCRQSLVSVMERDLDEPAASEAAPPTVPTDPA